MQQTKRCQATYARSRWLFRELCKRCEIVSASTNDAGMRYGLTRVAAWAEQSLKPLRRSRDWFRRSSVRITASSRLTEQMKVQCSGSGKTVKQLELTSQMEVEGANQEPAAKLSSSVTSLVKRQWHTSQPFSGRSKRPRTMGMGS